MLRLLRVELASHILGKVEDYWEKKKSVGTKAPLALLVSINPD